MREAYRDVREKIAELNADVEENLSGIRLVSALNREAQNEVYRDLVNKQLVNK